MLASRFDDLSDAFLFDKRPDGVVDHDDFRRLRRLRQAARNGLLAGVPSGDKPHGLREALALDIHRRALHIFAAQAEKNLIHGVGGDELAQGVDKNRHAFQGQELFGRIAAHADADAGGWNDGENAHSHQSRPAL